eukprot:365961-Chlamydomonas_euryale.AAC.14
MDERQCDCQVKAETRAGCGLLIMRCVTRAVWLKQALPLRRQAGAQYAPALACSSRGWRLLGHVIGASWPLLRGWLALSGWRPVAGVAWLLLRGWRPVAGAAWLALCGRCYVAGAVWLKCTGVPRCEVPLSTGVIVRRLARCQSQNRILAHHNVVQFALDSAHDAMLVHAGMVGHTAADPSQVPPPVGSVQRMPHGPS